MLQRRTVFWGGLLTVLGAATSAYFGWPKEEKAEEPGDVVADEEVSQPIEPDHFYDGLGETVDLETDADRMIALGWA